MVLKNVTIETNGGNIAPTDFVLGTEAAAAVPQERGFTQSAMQQWVTGKREYIATITQAGAAPPQTALNTQVLNSLGLGTPVWSYTAVGKYTLTFPTNYKSNAINVFFGDGFGSFGGHPRNYSWGGNNANTIIVYTYDYLGNPVDTNDFNIWITVFF